LNLMLDTERYKLLHGPYRTLRCRIGSRLFCEVRGQLIVCGFSAGRIPWPIGQRGRARSLVVCGDLAKAVQRESNIAICHWFGITAQTVSKWRKALDVPQVNEGTRRLYVDYAPERLPDDVRRRAVANANTPEANAKKSASMRAKPKPPHVLEALRRANVGKKHTPAQRARRAEAMRRNGRRPPVGRVWAPEEVAILGVVPDEETAQRTGRSLVAVMCKRLKLRIEKPNRRGRGLAK
jgi:hypothetical protein